MDLLRSLLIIPALDAAEIDSVRTSHADALVLDLHDGVPPDQVTAARAAVRTAAAELRGERRPVWVRTHPTQTLLAKDDIRATACEAIAGFIVPQVQSANHIHFVEALLRDAEAAAGLKEGTLRLIAEIESAAGLLVAAEIARASARLVALALDGAGFTGDMGVERTREGHELQYARSHIAVCARAAGLLAVDTAYPFVREMQGLLTDTAAARALGLHGKFVLTPGQAVTVNAVFRPAAHEVAYARRLHAAHEEAVARGEIPHLDGRIIDATRLGRARRLIDFAAAIEAKEQQAAV